MAYTEYTPSNYPGSNVYDIFTVSLNDIGNNFCKFSNPFVFLAGYRYDTGTTTLRTMSYTDMVSSYFVPVDLAQENNSGILKQTDTGAGIIENGAIKTRPAMSQKVFYMTDTINPDQQLTVQTDPGGTVTGTTLASQEPSYYSNYDIITLLNTSFDTFCFPANSTFQCGASGNDENPQMIIAVKRGNNKPFFTILP